jgi:hypothetical protein
MADFLQVTTTAADHGTAAHLARSAVAALLAAAYADYLAWLRRTVSPEQ